MKRKLHLLLPLLFLVQNLFAQTVIVKVTFASAPASASSAYAKAKFNKSLVFMQDLDDRGPDFRNIYAYFHGGTAPIDNATYAGKTFTDGCGYPVKWRATIAANARLQSNNSDWINYNNSLSWTEMANYISQDQGISDHGYYHNVQGTNPYSYAPSQIGINLSTDQKYIWDSLVAHGVQYLCRTVIVPNGDTGYCRNAKALGMIGVSTQGNTDGLPYYPAGVDAALAYNSIAQQTDPGIRDNTIILRSLKDGWTSGDVTYYTGTVIPTNWISGATTSNPKIWRLAGHYFSNTTEWGFWKQTMDSVASKAADNVWVPNFQEFLEYSEMKNKVIKRESLQGNVLYIALNYSHVADAARYRDLSLLVSSPGTITSVTMSGGGDSVHYNASTGLINVFYKKTSGFTNPYFNSGCGGVRRAAAPQGDGGFFVTTPVPYNPGDTVVFAPTTYNYIYMGHVNGTAGCPITVINGGGRVTVSGDVKIDWSSNVHLTGTGDPTLEYGFRSTHPGVLDGEGFAIKGVSTNIEMDHVETVDKQYIGIIKNEASEFQCDTSYVWPKRYDNIHVHHTWGHRINQDGWYVGSSDPYGISRATKCTQSTSNTSFTIPTTHPTSVSITVGAGLASGNVYNWGVGQQVTIEKSDNSNIFVVGTITAYNNSTGALTISSTSNGGTGTFASWNVFLLIFPRPTGLSNISFESNIMDSVGRSGLQWGGSDVGTNKIYWNEFYNNGGEKNDQQGCAMAIGSATNSIEVYGNLSVFTYKNGIFSYNYGQLFAHDNYIDSTGTCDSTGTGTLITLAAQGAMQLNDFDSRNPGPTTFLIKDNVFGRNTNSGKCITFFDSQSNYGTPNYLCNNTYLGAVLTTSVINNSAPSLTYSISCPGNLPPVANAGSDQSLNLPSNSITLFGSGTDLDGTVAAYGWTQISGPNTATIGAPTSATTLVSGLIVGTYTFRLTVTDNNAATSTDDVQVLVVGAQNSRQVKQFIILKHFNP